MFLLNSSIEKSYNIRIFFLNMKWRIENYEINVLYWNGRPIKTASQFTIISYQTNIISISEI